MSPARERPDGGGDRGRRPPEPAPSGRPPHSELRCARCGKPIRDLEMELYFHQTGLCFWCAYVDSQG